jgi:hypothetical protein
MYIKNTSEISSFLTEFTELFGIRPFMLNAQLTTLLYRSTIWLTDLNLNSPVNMRECFMLNYFWGTLHIAFYMSTLLQNVGPSTRCHNPNDDTLNKHGCKNSKAYKKTPSSVDCVGKFMFLMLIPYGKFVSPVMISILIVLWCKASYVWNFYYFNILS